MKRQNDAIQEVLLNPQNYKTVSVSHLMSFDNQPACALTTLNILTLCQGSGTDLNIHT